MGTEPVDDSVLIEGSWTRAIGTEISGLGSGTSEGARGVATIASNGSDLGVSATRDATGAQGAGGRGGWGVRNANGNVIASANVELREICAAVGGAGRTIGSSCVGEIEKSKA